MEVVALIAGNEYMVTLAIAVFVQVGPLDPVTVYEVLATGLTNILCVVSPVLHV